MNMTTTVVTMTTKELELLTSLQIVPLESLMCLVLHPSYHLWNSYAYFQDPVCYSGGRVIRVWDTVDYNCNQCTCQLNLSLVLKD